MKRWGYQLPVGAEGATQRIPSRSSLWARSIISCAVRPRPCISTPASLALPRGWPVSNKLLLGKLLFNKIRGGPARGSRANLGILFHGSVGFGNRDGLQHGHDLGAALFKPRRQQEVRAEAVPRLILAEAASRGSCTFDENAAGTTAVDRVEVEAVLNLRAIGVAELFVNALLLRERFVRANVESHVVRRTGAEGPASGRFVGLMREDYCLIRAAARHFELGK